MATYCEPICDPCGYVAELDGPREFYLDAQRGPQRYGHPLPRSDEVEKAGVSGSTTVACCPMCDEAHELVIEQLAPPGKFITCWLGAHNLIKPTCPQCCSTLMEQLHDVPCARCANGEVQGRGGDGGAGARLGGRPARLTSAW